MEAHNIGKYHEKYQPIPILVHRIHGFVHSFVSRLPSGKKEMFYSWTKGSAILKLGCLSINEQRKIPFLQDGSLYIQNGIFTDERNWVRGTEMGSFSLYRAARENFNNIWHPYIAQYRHVIYRWKALDLYFSVELRHR